MSKYDCLTCMCAEDARIAREQADQAEDRTLSLESQLREARALLAAKDEALQKAADLLEDAMNMASGEGYDKSWVGDYEKAAIACMTARSLTPADVLKRYQAMERVVEAVAELKRAKQTLDEFVVRATGGSTEEEGDAEATRFAEPAMARIKAEKDCFAALAALEGVDKP